MKCPKCGYLGFETGDRCKNCGYDFSLLSAPASAEPEISLGDRSAHEGPLLDAPLSWSLDEIHAARPEPDLDRLIGLPEPAADAEPNLDLDPVPTSAPARSVVRVPGVRAAGPAPAETDLPLFSLAPDPEDAPLVQAPTGPPRRPVAVRRATPEPPRARITPDPSRLKSLPWGTETRPHPRAPRVAEPTFDLPPEPTPAPSSPVDAPAAVGGRLAPGVRRVVAALIDVALFVAIDAAVLYFTLRIAGVGFDEVRILPVVPFVAFLVVLKVGYLAAFTAAGGQTIGKMAVGLWATGLDTPGVPVGAAIVRAAVLLLSLVPAGLPWLLALGGSGRGLHDRVAGTRVVAFTTD